MKKSDKNRRGAAHSGGRAGQQQLVRLTLPATLIALAVVITSFLLLALWQLPDHEQRQLQRASDRYAQAQAQRVISELRQLQKRLAAQAGEELPGALESADPQALATSTRQLARAFPEAESVQLLRLGRLGIAALRRDEIDLRNNIELDLVRGASTGEPAGPEAYPHEGRWLVSLAQPVPGSATEFQAGAILLTLPATRFAELLGDADPTRGASVLVEASGRRNQTFASHGSGDLETWSQEIAISPGAWRMRFTPSLQLARDLRMGRGLLWSLLALSTAAILLGTLLSAQLMRRALSRNIAAVLGAGGQPDLPGFAALYQHLQRRTQESDPVADAPPHEEGIAEDIPDEPAEDALAAPATAPAPQTEVTPPAQLSAGIFRAYDIRGIADRQLDDEVVHAIGLALGSEMKEQGQQEIAVGRDGRDSSERIQQALVRGLLDSGRDVIDIGFVPTPVLYFATHHLEIGNGVMVTGSHNPPEYNGLKVVLAGRPFAGAAMQTLHTRILEGRTSRGQGGLRAVDVRADYRERILGDIAIAQPLRVVLDAGNGIAGSIAPGLFEALGCEVFTIHCEVDGRFPNHPPDPSVADNLRDLIAAVQEHEADLGIAFDGDGDRLAVVSATGAVVPADRLLMLFAQDVVARNPGADVLFDIKCSRHLNSLISQYGGRPIMWKSGHSFMKEKMLETGALLGGEFSGHIFFRERWYGFDDGLYAGARLVEILSTSDPDLDRQLAALPDSPSTPEIHVAVGEDRKFELIERLLETAGFEAGRVTTLDGLRVDFPDGWGLARASNTGPTLVLRFEADDETALERIRQMFRDRLAAIDPELGTRF